MKILVAEDSAVYRRLIGCCLTDWGFDLAVVSNGNDAWKLLQEPGAPRLALLDWILPGMDGLELCKNIRRRPAGDPYIYTVLLTSRKEKADLLRAMEAGADDFLTKPFDEPELRARLSAGKRILELQEQLLSARESLRFATTHDALTGLCNRSEVLDLLRKEMARSARQDNPLGVILADIDHFKSINDTFGHLAGDGLLKELGKKLTSKLGVYDAAGRFAGEEFLLVMPGCDLETTIRRAEEIRQSVSAIPLGASRETNVTISLGVTSDVFGSEQEIQPLLQRLDQALARARQRGRNRVECAETAPRVCSAGMRPVTSLPTSPLSVTP